MLEFLQSPETVAVAAPLALVAAAPPPLPTFVPQGTPPPTAGGTIGGGSTGVGGAGGTAGGSGTAASGGGILPGVALAVRIDASTINISITFVLASLLNLSQSLLSDVDAFIECRSGSGSVTIGRGVARISRDICV